MGQGPDSDPELRRLYMDTYASLAKFTRNLVAGNPANQMKALFVSLFRAFFSKSDEDVNAATMNQRFGNSSSSILHIL